MLSQLHTGIHIGRLLAGSGVDVEVAEEDIRVVSALMLRGSYNNRFELEYIPIHGKVKDNDIILGIHSYANIVEGYGFL